VGLVLDNNEKLADQHTGLQGIPFIALGGVEIGVGLLSVD